MRTRSQTRNRNRQQQAQPAVVQPFHLEEPFVNPPLVPMADNRTMAQLLQAPTEGYEDAIVIPEINANFELKHGSARIWLEKEPPRSILTWDDLVSKFINQFFPPSKTTNLRNEITRFQQRFDESFYEAWDRFNDLLRACPHHGFSELHQLDTFYNALNANDQDSLNCYVVAKVIQIHLPPDLHQMLLASSTTEVSELKNMMKTMLIDKQKAQAPAPVKAVEQSCVTCGGAHSYKNCPATDGNVYRDNIQDSNTASSLNSGPSTPHFPTLVVSTPLKEPEQNLETSMDKVQKPSSENTAQVPPPEDHDSIFIEIPKPKAKETVQEPNSPDPNSYQPKLPYPERMKVREKDTPSAQQSRFMKLFKQFRLEIGLKDALIEMPKFNKWLSTLLRNKEKLEEIAITTVNAKCSAIILNKVPEKLEDPRKFLIPCALQELNRTNALADSGASINLLPHSIYKQLRLGALKPTRMTLELANRSVTHPMDPRVPIILGRPFLRTTKDLIDLYEEKLTLRVGNDELVFYAEKSKKSKNKQFAHAISIINFSKDEPFSGSTTNHSDALPPSSSPVKTSDNLEEFADELTLLKKGVHEKKFQVYSNPLFKFDDHFTSGNVNPLFNEMMEDVENENSNVSNSDEPVLLNTPLTDKVEYSDPEVDIDQIDAFLVMKVSSNFEEGYYDSEGDVIFLESLLSDDTTHNLAPEFPSGMLESKKILSLMTLLCEISTSQSPENFPIPVEDSEPVQEEIDVFLIPDDLIPLGVENDDFEDEDNSTFLPDHELPNLDHQDNPSSPRPPRNHCTFAKF
ncbi:reverse transcriptase domain-containing protein [Tanacetum coccineum]